MLVGGLMDSYVFSMVELYRKCFFGGFLWDHFKLVAWLNDMEAGVLAKSAELSLCPNNLSHSVSLICQKNAIFTCQTMFCVLLLWLNLGGKKIHKNPSLSVPLFSGLWLCHAHLIDLEMNQHQMSSSHGRDREIREGVSAVLQMCHNHDIF